MIRRPLITLGLALGLLTQSGCALGLAKSIHGFNMLEASPTAGQPIEIEETQNVILAFVFDTDYAERAHQRFLAACPRGEIRNVATKFSTDLGFFAYKNKIKMTGTCIQ